MIPNFLFIGPSRTGSSWVFELLRSHPEICVPNAKDLYFFDKYYHKGLDWYLKQFTFCSRRKMAGEVSHDYFSNARAIERIYAYNRKMKIMCCLRDPFERSWSSYIFLRRNGLAPGAFYKETDNYMELINESLYYTHLLHILSVFPKRQVLILFFEDLQLQPTDFARKIYSFLGVNMHYRSPVIDKIVNKSAWPRSKKLARMVKAAAVNVRRWGYPEVVGYAKRNPLIFKILYQEMPNTPMKKEIIHHFPADLVDRYNFEIDKLDLLLGMDLTRWKVKR
jgi:hypothetical protein